MSGDETMVLQYLNCFPNLFVAAAEVSKRAGDRRRYKANPDWAKPALQLLTMQGVLEVDASGHYRVKSRHKTEEEELPPTENPANPYDTAAEPAAPSPADAPVSPEVKPVAGELPAQRSF